MEEILVKLSNSKFRSGFKLKSKDILYINQKGIKTIKEHTYEFIKKRLASKIIENDGKQTPMRGHPTFIAQHATATCCRGCLYKWHKIPQNVELTKGQIEYVVNLIMKWIEKEYFNCKADH